MARRAFTHRASPPSGPHPCSLLSLGYTLVYNEIASLLDVWASTPISAFPPARFGHATLASNLLEEFRVPLVDSS